MAGFTDEEVATAVDRFLFKSLEVPTLKTGARDVLTLRDRVYDLITTALLLRPDSYFYVVYLTRNRLMGLLLQQISALESIIAAGPNTTRPVKKVNSTTDLAAAQSSLLELSAGLNQRSTGVRGTLGPAVDRFRRSISGFVSTELTKNVVVGSDVTETGPELRQSISSIWTDALERHEEIIELAAAINSALSTLEQVRLPESSVRDIVSKISSRLDEVKEAMEGTSAAEQSRTAMLDLLTMRTLLTKASAFRNPELVLMPKTRDTSSAILADSAGTQATIIGTVSAPFNYDPGAVLVLDVNGGPSVNIELPRPMGSRAELRSRVFSPWVAPTIGDEAAFVVNFSSTVTYTFAAAYASGPLAATALDAGLSPSVDVSWDSATSQLVFRSVDAADSSHLSLLINTAARSGFRAWAFPAMPIESKGTGVPIEEIVATIGLASPLIGAQRTFVSFADFVAARDPVVATRLTHVLDQGSDLVSTGVGQVTSPSRNFETLGIRQGMGLQTTAPTSVKYVITAVSGSALTITPTPPVGTLTYYIGPDYRSIPSGARVRISSGANRANTGLYRVAALGGDIARVTLDRNVQVEDTELSVSIFSDFLSIFSVGTTTSSAVGVTGPSPGATALGFSTGPLRRAGLTRVQLSGAGDLLLRGVRAEDIIDLTSPSGLDYSVVIEELLSPTALLLAEPVPYEAGSWTYQIRSWKAALFTTLQEKTTQFLTSETIVDFAEVDDAVGRLIRGARYDSVISDTIEDYLSTIEDLRSDLIDYEVSREKTIDNVVKTLREQGLDRALDLFLNLKIQELFSMEPDGVSYATWLVAKSAAVAREVVPVSKFARSQRVLQEWRTISFQPDAWKPGPDERNEP